MTERTMSRDHIRALLVFRYIMGRAAFGPQEAELAVKAYQIAQRWPNEPLHVADWPTEPPASEEDTVAGLVLRALNAHGTSGPHSSSGSQGSAQSMKP